MTQPTSDAILHVPPQVAALPGARLDAIVAAFLVISVVVIVTPGQDTALTIRNTLFGGRRAGVFTAAGVASGQLVWTIAASAGVTALLVASEPVFSAVRLAGAAYLVYLGATTLWSTWRGQRRPATSVNGAASLRPGRSPGRFARAC